MNELFPAIEPYNTGFLKVSDLHTLYYEESGNPNGRPVIFLHGGPGGGTSPTNRQFFDPAFYRIILLDQRGCGKSTPPAELRENTTWDLVEDIEKLRKLLGIDRWLVFGGSWGSTLSLAYASKHADRVVGLILRGIFLCRKSEIDWFYEGGAANIYADAWEKYIAPIPVEKRAHMVKSYYEILTGSDPAARLEAAKAWSIWEASTSKLHQDAEAIARFEDPTVAIIFASIECHYFIHDAFFPDQQFLLNEARKFSHIPTRIVQGRYDVICPMISAWDLHKSMPEADLRIVPDAGHSAYDPGNTSELVQATEDFKSLFK